MNDTTAVIPTGPRPGPSGLPDALLPRPEDADLARRARAASELITGFSGSVRLDNRFCQAVRDLARAIAGLEGMRAVGLAPEIADEALGRLGDVLTRVEAAVESARPELEAERRERATPQAPGPKRRGRPRATPA